MALDEVDVDTAVHGGTDAPLDPVRVATWVAVVVLCLAAWVAGAAGLAGAQPDPSPTRTTTADVVVSDSAP